MPPHLTLTQTLLCVHFVDLEAEKVFSAPSDAPPLTGDLGPWLCFPVSCGPYFPGEQGVVSGASPVRVFRGDDPLPAVVVKQKCCG